MNAPLQPPKPRVVQGAAPAAEPVAAVPRQPRTVAGMPAAAAPVAAVAAQAPPMPRRVPGVARRTLAVTAAELGRLFPEQPEAVLQPAAAVLAAVSPDGFGWRQVQALGAAAQERFGRASDRLLAVSRDEAQRAALQHVGRLVELLGEMLPAYGASAGLWSRRPRQQDLQRGMREVDQLRKTLRDLLPRLDGLCADLDRAQAELDQARLELAGAALACEYLSRPELNLPRDGADRLPERGLELSRAAVAALQSLQLLAAQHQSLDSLRRQIRETVLTALPAWLATWSAAPAEPNETERFNLHQALVRLIDTFKS
ncbi:hypothetical protein GT347_22390 [Xylophilus rhododendri]|uniref:Uncharacterized protein n=1 Tax=Xylophilus rhododendri TaxID=2697032 RepID=A0A857J8V9_9BURK|nr:hypothetical protein [Xylophilus rhododendri]QHJ00481.1 hypothetical protein GT347_22390 [Xylophilus rhododendri]